MRKLSIVGIGAGHPDHITVQGIKALQAADVLFVPDKGADKADLAAVRRAMIAQHVGAGANIVGFSMPVRDTANPSYGAGVADWHQAIAQIFARLIEDEVGEEGAGAFLVWGDPSLYDSTLRILERVRAMGIVFATEVVPGITSVQALTAAHGIALNRIGEPVTITTGRRLKTAVPEGDMVVMLDGQLAFEAVHGDHYDIFWGAYLGSADEILISGRLADVAVKIAERRAAARSEHGWIMDTYLLRKRDG